MDGLITGRIVHFNSDSECRAAIITQVWSQDGMVNLYVFPDGVNEIGGVRTSIAFDTGARSPESGLPLNPFWHWPER